MIDAIVYYSKHGSTKRYAMALAKALNTCAYTISEAKHNLNKSSKIIYMAPVHGPKLKKYYKVYNSYLICAVCAVGILPETILTKEIIKNENLIYKPIYYLQGVLDFNKLSCCQKRYFKRFKKNIINYKEIYYDTAMDYNYVLENIFSKTFVDYYDETKLEEIISKYQEFDFEIVS